MTNPTPRGYHKMVLPIVGADGQPLDSAYFPRVVVLSCDKCGALVLSYLIHNKRHKAEEIEAKKRR